MAYVAPNWRDGAPPALDAEALNAISQALAKLPMENGGTFATSGAAGLYNLINAAATMTSSTLASGDYVGVQDVSAGIGKRTTLSGQLDRQQRHGCKDCHRFLHRNWDLRCE